MTAIKNENRNRMCKTRTNLAAIAIILLSSGFWGSIYRKLIPSHLLNSVWGSSRRQQFLQLPFVTTTGLNYVISGSNVRPLRPTFQKSKLDNIRVTVAPWYCFKHSVFPFGYCFFGRNAHNLLILVSGFCPSKMLLASIKPNPSSSLIVPDWHPSPSLTWGRSKAWFSCSRGKCRNNGQSLTKATDKFCYVEAICGFPDHFRN